MKPKVRFKSFSVPDPTTGEPLEYFFVEVKRHWYSGWHVIMDGLVPELIRIDRLSSFRKFYITRGYKIVE